MKKSLRVFALILAVVMGAALFGACSEQAGGPKTAKPASDKTNVNVCTSSYIRNASLIAKELHINNDMSAWVRYSLSTREEESVVKEKMDKLLENLNKQRYTDKKYDEGYRVFWMQDGDIKLSDDGNEVTIRITNLNHAAFDYYTLRTVGEILKSGDASSLEFSKFTDVNSGESRILKDTSERDQEKLKVWRLKNLEENLKVTIEGHFRYFLDGSNEKPIKQEDGSLVFINKSDVYFIYQESVLSVGAVVAICVSGVLVLAAAVVLTVVLVRRRKNGPRRSK